MSEVNVDITNGQSNEIILTVPDTQRVTTVKETVQTVVLLDKYSIAGLSVIGDKNFVYTQGVAAATWVVTHNLKKRVSVSVVDSAENIVIGEVEYNSDNQVTLTFSGAFSGKAYLN